MKVRDLEFWSRQNIEACDAECDVQWVNFECYRKDQTTGKLKFDEEATRKEAEYARDRKQRKADLWFALRSRVLTTEEMELVISYDYTLLVPENASFNPAELEKRFNEGLLQQFKLRIAYEKNNA